MRTRLRQLTQPKGASKDTCQQAAKHAHEHCAQEGRPEQRNSDCKDAAGGDVALLPPGEAIAQAHTLRTMCPTRYGALCNTEPPEPTRRQNQQESSAYELGPTMATSTSDMRAHAHALMRTQTHATRRVQHHGVTTRCMTHKWHGTALRIRIQHPASAHTAMGHGQSLGGRRPEAAELDAPAVSDATGSSINATTGQSRKSRPRDFKTSVHAH